MKATDQRSGHVHSDFRSTHLSLVTEQIAVNAVNFDGPGRLNKSGSRLFSPLRKPNDDTIFASRQLYLSYFATYLPIRTLTAKSPTHRLRRTCRPALETTSNLRASCVISVDVLVLVQSGTEKLKPSLLSSVPVLHHSFALQQVDLYRPSRPGASRSHTWPKFDTRRS